MQRNRSSERVFAVCTASLLLALPATLPATGLPLSAALAQERAGPGILLAESNSAGERQPGKGMDPELEAKLDALAAEYKKLATVNIDSLVANSDKMLGAMQAGDVATARQAWIDARAGYERSEIFTIKFPSLDAAIDSWPNSETGFHGIEAKLFTAGAPLLP